MSSFPSAESFKLLRQRKARYVAFHWRYYDSRSADRAKERIEKYRPYLTPISNTSQVWLFEITAWPEESQ